MEGKEVKQEYGCHYCNVKSTSAISLYEHVMGNKHRAHLSNVCPEMVPLICSFQNFLDVYMIDDPVLGLEYIVEVQGKNYQCTCSLCDVVCTARKNLIAHLLSVEHMKKYLDKHHPLELDPNYKHLHHKIKHKMVNEIAFKIQDKYGRQIIGSMVDSNGPPPAKVAKYKDTKKSSGRHSSGDPASTRQRVPMANPQDPKKAIQADIYEKLKFLQFKYNIDFMNYLREVEIRNDEDAKFMENITKNCTNALLEFREKQINTQRKSAHSLHVPAYAKGAGQERDRHVTVGKMDSCLSRGEAEFSGGTATPVSQAVEKTDATEVFFSSIKNMEESEVIGVFRSIAATNPAFKGIDIPNVMKYLQETGRLKKT